MTKKPAMGLFKAITESRKYQNMREEERKMLQERRLQRMIVWAGENSPYYAELYKDLNEGCGLRDLPPVNKKELMAHWDEWVTDRNITLMQVNKFMEDIENVGRRLKGRYLVFTTSGSTGNPLVTINDEMTNNVMSAVNLLRSFARKEDMRRLMKRGAKTIGVFATGGFYLSNGSVRARLLRMPWKRGKIGVTSALQPVSEIVKEINAFQPSMLGGYPSSLEMLIEEQVSGRLHIAPVIIMTGGEYLSESLRDRLSETFNCYVQTAYACTEGGTIACECVEKHFHVNDDWVIVEPVDRNNRPVPFGVRSDKILITNLFNYTQPFIRYEVTDRVIMHNEPCKCGNPSPWLELEGRMDDVVSLVQDGIEIKLAPLAIYAALKEVHELRRFQMLVHPGNQIVLRIETMEGITKREAFAKAKAVLEKFLKLHGVETAEIILSCEKPMSEKKSGKFKHIIKSET